MAMRLARAFTGKDLVATFPGFYHGTHDYALVNGDRTTGQGVPAAAIESMMQLPYNSPEAFELIRANADKLALVFIEPVQVRAHFMYLADRVKLAVPDGLLSCSFQTGV